MANAHERFMQIAMEEARRGTAEDVAVGDASQACPVASREQFASPGQDSGMLDRFSSADNGLA